MLAACLGDRCKQTVERGLESGPGNGGAVAFALRCEHGQLVRLFVEQCIDFGGCGASLAVPSHGRCDHGGADGNGSQVADQVEEESYLKKELHDLLFQPGLAGRTRQMIVNLLSETEENMHDLDFIRTNLSSLRA